MDLIYWISTVLTAAVIGLIPALIAKHKGYSFVLWWFYGFMLFIVAIIHVSLIKDRNSRKPIITGYVQRRETNNGRENAVEELRKYKELKDMGVITDAEFQLKKTQLLKYI